jgi:predicted oxidoreductase
MSIPLITLAPTFKIARLVHGHWRIKDWNLTTTQLHALTSNCLELGIDTIDHADIYGNYECEALFGSVLKLDKSLRAKLKIITKCGIKLLSDKYPNRQLKYYDYSSEHLINSVNQSLKNFNTDYIDCLLLHRPSPYFNPETLAETFNALKKAGKVLHFGVSNFTPQQFELLAKFTDEPLVTNQIELSPLALQHFKDGTIEHLIQHQIKPMAWSPMAGGRLFKPQNESEQKLNAVLTHMANELSIGIDTLAFAWLLQHPAQIIPVIGTQNLNRIKAAIKAFDVKLNLEQWFQIYTATGTKLP